MKKRLLSILLTACLLMGLLPTAALAGEDAVSDKLSDDTSVTAEQNITRAQLAEMVYNAFMPGTKSTDMGFQDIGSDTDVEVICTSEQRAAINVLAAAGIISGTKDGEGLKFNPTGTVTRAEAAVILWRATGCKSNPNQVDDAYSDINSTAWYAPAVQALTAAGIIQGNKTGNFSPNTNATVQMVNALISRCDTANFTGFGSGATRLKMVMEAYAKYKDSPLATVTATPIDYADISTCTEEEREAIQFFTSRGIVSGYNPANNNSVNLFGPNDAASNLQAAVFLYRCAAKFEPATITQSLSEDSVLTAQAVSYAVPNGVQQAVTTAWNFLKEQIGEEAVGAYMNNPDAPIAPNAVTALTAAFVPDAPTFSLETGTNSENQSVTINVPTGTTVYYTTNGTTPTVGSTQYIPETPILVSENMTIKAVAVKNSLYSDVAEAPHIITLNANGGTVEPSTLTTGVYGKLTSLPPASRDGYTFDGWFTEETGGTPVTTDTVFNANTTIYAHWTSDGGDAALTYSIGLDVSGTHTFDPAVVGYGAQTSKTVTVRNTGTGATGTLSVALSGTNPDAFTVSPTSISSIAPDGTDSFTVVPNTGLPAGIYTATVTVNGDSVDAQSFAVSFTVNAATEYTITFDGNGGTLSATSMTTTGQKLASLPDPPRNGYIFDGWFTAVTGGDRVTAATVFSGNTTIYAHWTAVSSGGSSSGGGSSSSSGTTTKNPDGSTTTTTTDKTTGTVTETTKNTDGSTTTVETKKDGTVTETVKTADGTTGTVVTDKDGNVTEAKANVSTAAAKEAAKTGEAVTLPVEVPSASTTEDAPAVEITLSKSSGSVKVEIPVEKTTPGTVAVIVKTDGTEEIVSTSRVTENGVSLKLNGSTTVKVFDNAKSFNDVPVSNVFYDEVCSLSAREIMVGKSGAKFDLYSSVTLNQLSNVAGRITGAVDVKDYSGGIAWGQANGLKTGNESATRGDMLSALYTAAGSPAVEDTSSLSKLNDASAIPDDMKAVTAWALQNGVLKGTADGQADLGANVTRGQACALAGRTMLFLD